MTTERILDLGPFFPPKPTAVIPPRDDGAAEAGPNGLAEGDMNTGASRGGYNAAVPSMPPIEKLPDTARALPRLPTVRKQP